MATLYAFLGLLAGMTGTLFGSVSANPWALLATGNLLLLFSLFMLDVFPVPVPRKLMGWAGGKSGGSFGAVFLLGASSGVVAAPCGAPAFAVVLTWVAATQAGAMGFLYLFTFSLGMTAILVVVGALLRDPGPSPPVRKVDGVDEEGGGNHHDRRGPILLHQDGVQPMIDRILARRVTGVILSAGLLAAPSILKGQEVALPLGTQAPAASLQDLQGNPVQLLDYVEAGKPTLIEFWASWCENCEALQPQLDQIHAALGVSGEHRGRGGGCLPVSAARESAC